MQIAQTVFFNDKPQLEVSSETKAQSNSLPMAYFPPRSLFGAMIRRNSTN